MLRNGFGEHNIQGIGDKHIPLIHNVMNTDFAVAVSDRATDRLGVLFSTDAGRAYLARAPAGAATSVVDALPRSGSRASATCSAAIKVAKHCGSGRDDVIVTVATDGAAMYGSEREQALAKRLRRRASTRSRPAETFGEHLLGAGHRQPARADASTSATGSSTSATSPGSSSRASRSRTSRRAATSVLARAARARSPAWDELIGEFNARTGVAGVR